MAARGLPMQATSIRNSAFAKSLIALTFAAVLAAAIFLLISPRVTAVYYLFWGRDSFKTLFYEGLGLGEHVSTILSTMIAFVYGIAWIFFIAFVVSLFRRFDVRKMLVGFCCFVVLYASAPLAHVLYKAFEPLVCFNQVTGEPVLWFVVRDGKIIMFDSPGVDPVDRAKKVPVTPEICRTFQLQEKNIAPIKVSFERALDLPKSRLWYWKSKDRIEFYESPGDNLIPGTNELLRPVTSGVLDELNKRVQRDRIDREARSELKRRDRRRSGLNANVSLE
jgi:hypothetical protein